MKKAFAVFAFLLPALFSCECVLAQQAIPLSFFGTHVNNPTINGETSYPVLVPYGEFRNWDVYLASWPDIETCEATTASPTDTCFGGPSASNFVPLQNELYQLHTAGVNNVMLTLSRTPAWAVTTQQATDSNCNYYDPNIPQINPQYDGACYAPNGTNGENHLNGNGTGDNLIWRRWITALATYANSQTYCPNTSCAHIKYWEIWNEFNRNNPNVLETGATTTKVSWYALNGTNCGNPPCPTPDQLIRMAEDANCIITGRVTTIISNGGETCAHAWSTVGLTAPIDSTAEIVQPSTTGPGGSDVTAALDCFLYCNATACGNWYGASCVNSANRNTRNGANAIDILDFHSYPTMANPEVALSNQTNGVPAMRNTNVLQEPELTKPLWMGEGSFGNVDPPTNQSSLFWLDPYTQGGFAVKYFASIWANTLPACIGTGCTACSWTGSSAQVCQQAMWYQYDNDTTVPTPGTSYKTAQWGAMYCPGSTPHGTCANGGPNNNGVGLLHPQSDMYNVGVGWLQNATPATPPTANPLCNPASLGSTVWQCEFNVNGALYFMVWDNKYAANAQGQTNYCASTYGNPYVCGNTPYTVPEGYEYWEDLSKTVHLSSEGNPLPFLIGLNPVLLCPNSQCLP
jgi:hypothetical protein